MSRTWDTKLLDIPIVEILEKSQPIPISTSEVVERLELRFLAEGASQDSRGVLVAFPMPNRLCPSCRMMHDCMGSIPLASGIVKERLDRLDRFGVIEKISRGTARAALWLWKAELPANVDDLPPRRQRNRRG